MSEMAAHQLLSGLVIYKSWIRNADGTRGVVGGPHRVLTETESSYQVNVRSFHVKSIQTMILILYLLRSTMVISWSVKVEYETMVNQGH